MTIKSVNLLIWKLNISGSAIKALLFTPYSFDLIAKSPIDLEI